MIQILSDHSINEGDDRDRHSTGDSVCDCTSDPIRVLLIDDQPMIAEAIRRMLVQDTATALHSSRQDITFHYCSDPTQALKIAKAFQPTVILQDLVMPELDGLLLVQFLRSRNAPTVDIPLVVLSGKEEPWLKAKAFELGANDYLVKLPDQSNVADGASAISQPLLQ